MKDKIIELFKNKHKDRSKPSESEAVKFFDGFNYIRLDKDKNGNNFNPEHLAHYAEQTRYLVTVMREHDNKTSLYNYEVPYEQLTDFLLKFKNNEFDGQIVDIDKYIPENFA